MPRPAGQDAPKDVAGSGLAKFPRLSFLQPITGQTQGLFLTVELVADAKWTSIQTIETIGTGNCHAMSTAANTLRGTGR